MRSWVGRWLLMAACCGVAPWVSAQPAARGAEAWPPGLGNEQVWRQRAVESVARIQVPRSQIRAAVLVASIYPDVLRGPGGLELRGILHEASAAVDGLSRTQAMEALVKWDQIGDGVRHAHQLQLEEYLTEFRERGHGIKNVTSDLRKVAALPSAERDVDAVLRELEQHAARKGQEADRSALALAYQGLAFDSLKRKDVDRAQWLTQRMITLFKSHPVLQDERRGNTDAPSPHALVKLLLETGRRAQIDELAALMRPADAENVWVPLAEHVAEAGDFKGARQVVTESLTSPENARAATLLTAALDGRTAGRSSAADRVWPWDALDSAIYAVAKGHARIGQAETALRVLDFDRAIPLSQALAGRALAEAALAAGQVDAARQLINRTVEVHKLDPDEDDLELSRTATTAARAGMSEVVRELAARTPTHYMVEPLVAVARDNHRRNEPERALELLRAAAERGDKTDSGGGGPARNLMTVAAELQVMGRAQEASDMALRAVARTEAMNDPFFFAAGGYWAVIDGCVKIGREEVIEWGYGLLRRDEDRAVYATVVLAVAVK